MYAGISTVPSPFYQALKIFERTVQIQLLQRLDGADSGNEEKSKRAEKYGTKKSKERREEPLGTMSYQTSSKRSPPFWLLIELVTKKTQVFWHQSDRSNIFLYFKS